MPPIENIKPMSWMEKFKLRSANLLKINAISYGASAAIGFGAVGPAAQQAERTVSGYSPEAHAESIKDFTDSKNKLDEFQEFKKKEAERKLEGIKGFFSELVTSFKQNGLDPRKHLENTVTYKQMIVMYKGLIVEKNNNLEIIDKGVFYISALLAFAMLGGFLSRKWTEVKGDVVRQEEDRKKFEKLNELIDSANETRRQIEELGMNSLTKEQISQIDKMLEEGANVFPEGSELS